MGLRSDKSMPPRTQFFEDFEDAQGFIDRLVDEQREVYFGCATFADPAKGRKATNTAAHQCLYVDIDCGPNKEYKTKKEGVAALLAFIEKRDLPQPLIVDSGNGVHAYWVLEEALGYNEWSYLAEALKTSCQKEGFAIDPSVTADGARILRVPGTFNFKAIEKPKAVSVKAWGERVCSDLLKLRLDFQGATSNKKNAKRELDSVTLALIERGETNFKKILTISHQQAEVEETVKVIIQNKDGSDGGYKTEKRKVLRSAGCAQLARADSEQATLEEPTWYNALSIAIHCNDGENMIHEISHLHPDYSIGNTVEKAERQREFGPALCSTFQSKSDRPELCVNCPLQGKIRSPIVLGKVIPQATPLDNLKEDIWHAGLQEETTINIPIVYPYPFYRPKSGGVAIRGTLVDTSEPVDMSDGEEDVEEMLVHESDIWVQDRIIDPVLGHCIQVARILPVEGLLEFLMPLTDLASKEKCKALLAFHGLSSRTDKRANMLRQYLDAWNSLLKEKDAKHARIQFGWQDKDTKFVIGSKEIQSDGTVKFSPPSSSTADIAIYYTSAGTLPAWKTVINTYNNPGNEARAFVLFLSFGSALFKFFNEGSMITHLTNSDSGVGKTSLQEAVNSVWGHPKDTLLTENDTNYARHQRFGVLNNIVACIDEITNILPEDASDMVYRASYNRGRNRLNANTNSERKNNTTWETIIITSGNNSLYDTLIAHKSSSSGELMRVLEIEILKDTNLTKEQSDHLFKQVLRENYGLAGEEFMKHVVSAVPETKALLLDTQKRVDVTMGFESNHRFYSCAVAAGFTGAIIAKQLGLHDIDIDRVWDWAVKTLAKTKASTTEKGSSKPQELIGEFLNENMQSTLILQSVMPLNDLQTRPTRLPYRDLLVRYEEDTKRIYISTQALQKWCNSKRATYGPLKDNLAQLGLVDENCKKFNLATGTVLPGTPIGVLVIKGDLLGFLPALDT